MLSLLAATALVVDPVPDKYVRLSCAWGAETDTAFILDLPTAKFTSVYRGDVRRLYKLYGQPGSLWDSPKLEFVMDSWPSGALLEWKDENDLKVSMTIDSPETAGEPIGFSVDGTMKVDAYPDTSAAATYKPVHLEGVCVEGDRVIDDVFALRDEDIVLSCGADREKPLFWLIVAGLDSVSADEGRLESLYRIEGDYRFPWADPKPVRANDDWPEKLQISFADQAGLKSDLTVEVLRSDDAAIHFDLTGDRTPEAALSTPHHFEGACMLAPKSSTETVQ